MGLKDKFTGAFTRANTMSDPEKKVNEIVGKILLKKSIIPIVILVAILIAGTALKLNVWLQLVLLAAVGVVSYFYIRNQSKKFQNFKPYVGNLISIEEKNGEYILILKQGKMPIKLSVKHGIDDPKRLKKNQLLQISYNPDEKIAIIVK
jgi:hypothetical protein